MGKATNSTPPKPKSRRIWRHRFHERHGKQWVPFWERLSALRNPPLPPPPPPLSPSRSPRRQIQQLANQRATSPPRPPRRDEFGNLHASTARSSYPSYGKSTMSSRQHRNSNSTFRQVLGESGLPKISSRDLDKSSSYSNYQASHSERPQVKRTTLSQLSGSYPQGLNPSSRNSLSVSKPTKKVSTPSSDHASAPSSRQLLYSHPAAALSTATDDTFNQASFATDSHDNNNFYRNTPSISSRLGYSSDSTSREPVASSSPKYVKTTNSDILCDSRKGSIPKTTTPRREDIHKNSLHSSAQAKSSIYRTTSKMAGSRPTRTTLLRQEKLAKEKESVKSQGSAKQNGSATKLNRHKAGGRSISHPIHSSSNGLERSECNSVDSISSHQRATISSSLVTSSEERGRAMYCQLETPSQKEGYSSPQTITSSGSFMTPKKSSYGYEVREKLYAREEIMGPSLEGNIEIPRTRSSSLTHLRKVKKVVDIKGEQKVSSEVSSDAHGISAPISRVDRSSPSSIMRPSFDCENKSIKLLPRTSAASASSISPNSAVNRVSRRASKESTLLQPTAASASRQSVNTTVTSLLRKSRRSFDKVIHGRLSGEISVRSSIPRVSGRLSLDSEDKYKVQPSGDTRDSSTVTPREPQAANGGRSSWESSSIIGTKEKEAGSAVADESATGLFAADNGDGVQARDPLGACAEAEGPEEAQGDGVVEAVQQIQAAIGDLMAAGEELLVQSGRQVVALSKMVRALPPSPLRTEMEGAIEGASTVAMEVRARLSGAHEQVLNVNRKVSASVATIIQLQKLVRLAITESRAI